MTEERKQQEDNNAPQEAVTEAGKAPDSDDRFFQNSFFVVVIVISVVAALVGVTILLAAKTKGADTDALSAMLGTGTTVIGTLVGSFLGLRQGQQGRDEAQERTEQSRRDTERVLWSALAYVPADKAEEILRSARSSSDRTS
jgi:hypothetical protein